MENNNILFNDIFIEKNSKNIDNFPQYTIGKYGLNKIKNSKHSVLNHKNFFKNYLILGIGTDEIVLNINIDSGCCSPIYKTYLINNTKYSLYFFHFIKKIINTNKNKFSKKSTRRENEFDFLQLKKFNILIPDNSYFKMIKFIDNVYNFNEKIKQKEYLIKNIKKYYLKKMFV